jgi:hypothetical protein
MIERDEPFADLASDDLLALFDDLELPRPNPMWYVGRLKPAPSPSAASGDPVARETTPPTPASEQGRRTP